MFLGVQSTQSCVLIPVATGMAMMLVLLTLKQQRPEARYVVWPRIDQKSCFKCILSAGQSYCTCACTHTELYHQGVLPLTGFEPVVVENILEGDELRTDLASIERAVEKCGANKVLCVLTTTSCFAPRAADRYTCIAN